MKAIVSKETGSVKFILDDNIEVVFGEKTVSFGDTVVSDLNSSNAEIIENITVQASNSTGHVSYKMFQGICVVDNGDCDLSLADLKAKKVKEIKRMANQLLSETDWYVIRKSEKAKNIPSDIATERDNIRTLSTDLEAIVLSFLTLKDVLSFEVTYTKLPICLPSP